MAFFIVPFYASILTAFQNLFILLVPNKLINKTKTIDFVLFVFILLFVFVIPIIHFYIIAFYLGYIWVALSVLLLIMVMYFYINKLIKKLFFSEKRIQGSIEFGKLWYLIMIYMFIYATICWIIFFSVKYSEELLLVFGKVGELYQSLFFITSLLFAGSFIWIVILTFRSKGFIRRKLRPLINGVDSNLIYAVTLIEGLVLTIFICMYIKISSPFFYFLSFG